jgi:dihydroorotase
VKTIIRGGTVVNADRRQVADVLIESGIVTEVGSPDTTGAKVVDASGCLVTPGFVDLHTHLREPGREGAEDMVSGTRAAVAGGYTAVVAMPNTEPAIDNASVVRHLQQRATQALCEVQIAGSITIGRAGTQLTPMAELYDLGVRMFTDDGGGVQSAGVMRRALEYASSLDVVIAQHCEDETLSNGGHMHEGTTSALLGVPGIPAEAEEVMVMRDIALLQMTRASLHFLHLSTEGSVAMVAAAKAQGLRVTAEATPHHFTLTDEFLASFDPAFKVNPPIRSSDHVDAVRTGLRDGVIDAIATDHAPHVPQLKQAAFADAPCGMLGLETAASLALSELDLTDERFVEVMSTNPARIARLDGAHGRIAVGRPANICVIDPAASWTVHGSDLQSKASNTPYEARTVKGQVRHTFSNGDHVVDETKVIK